MKNTTKLAVILAITIAFFSAEIAIGFKTKSLALIADAFHYFNDVVAYAVGFTASYVQERGQQTHRFTYAFHRAELVGAFFNAVFLLALALSISLQSLERFVHLEVVNSPELVLMSGCIGLALNIVSALIIQDHGPDHSHGVSPDVLELKPAKPQNDIIHWAHHHRVARPADKPQLNLNLVAVLIHLGADALNNFTVIIVSLILWKLRSPNRYYADPAASLAISFFIFASAVPTTLRCGRILLEGSPNHLDLVKVKEDLLSCVTQVPNVLSLHDLHVWHLSQSVLLASLHVCVPAGTTLEQWEQTERHLQQCFQEYGITHVTISPETQIDFKALALESAEDVDRNLKCGCILTSNDDWGCSVTDLKMRKGNSTVGDEAV